MMTAPRRSQRGFSLVEILLVAALFCMCSVAIFRTFLSGVKLWEHAQRFSMQEDISIFFDKLSEDLRNGFYYSKIKFNGMETQMTFPAFVTTPADENSSRAKEGLIDQMGAVQYRLDYEEHKLYRSQANYSQALKGKFEEGRPLVNAIDGIRFRYYYPDKKGLQAYAKAQDTIPSGVYVEVTFHDETSERTMSRFIGIPAGI
jgi:prepilin-type N-terminal cleavage/methylation domain-containing protein